MEIDFGFYNSQPNSDLDNTKPDLRIIPHNHSDSLVCTCSARKETNTYVQSQCRYYKRHSYARDFDQDKICRYDRFGIMCDKVIDKDGRSVN
jgi:hypothetical protein